MKILSILLVAVFVSSTKSYASPPYKYEDSYKPSYQRNQYNPSYGPEYSKMYYESPSSYYAAKKTYEPSSKTPAYTPVYESQSYENRPYKKGTPESSKESKNEPKWGYGTEGNAEYLAPENWGIGYPACNGINQSPIDIISKDASYRSDLKKIEIFKSSSNGKPCNSGRFQNCLDEDEIWEMSNTGKGFQLEPLNFVYSFRLFPDDQLFDLRNVHLHWNKSDHFIDGEKFEGDIHAVFQSRNFPSRFSVVGFMLDLAAEANPGLDLIVEEIQNIREYKAKVYKEIRLDYLIPLEAANYYRYSGSLTVPGCTEAVLWNVVDSPIIEISRNQLAELQTILGSSGAPVVTNSRPIQPLNSRIVGKSFR